VVAPAAGAGGRGGPAAPGAPAATQGAAPAGAAQQTAAAPQQPGALPAGPVPVSTLTAAGIQAPTLFAELPAYAIPKTPIPAGITMQAGLSGDVERGRALFARSPCVGCHVIQGVSMSPIGPTLTHVGSRTTIGAGLYPNDAEHLAAWIKNSPAMKPGSKMPPQGKGIRDPNSPAVGTLDDAQIADIVAYLLALK
jgi:cytochrome c oxidase subunit 2